MPRRSPRFRSWSDLPPEILDLFLQRLLHPDCSAFGGVCKPWRSVFLDKRRLSLPLPCLVLTPVNGPVPRRLWTLHQDRLRRLKFPKPNILSQHWIAGSSMGWLVIASHVSVYYSMHVLNPTSNQQIPLPPIFSGDQYLYAPTRVIQNVVLSSPPTTNDSLILVILWCQSTQVRYLLGCSPGDPRWTCFKNETHNVLKESCDAVFHKGELYVLCLNADVLVCVLSHNAKYSVRVRIPTMMTGTYFYKRLVRSDNELLLVVRQSNAAMDGSSLPPTVSVFRITDEQGGRWVRVESLGDRVLLIGCHGAESLCIKHLMGSTYEPNCVYYHTYAQFLGKYSMKDGSIQSFTSPNFLKGRRTCPDWVVAKAW